MSSYLYKYTPLLLIVALSASWTSNSIAKNAPWVGQTYKNFPCRGKVAGYGPFDYTLRASLPIHNLNIVEGAHFTPNVEALIKGQSGNLIGDIDYTLRAWPNHHRALNALSRYKLLFSAKKKLVTPVECYFQRAINFSPKDATTRMLYAMFLQKYKHYDAAEKQYNQAKELSPNNPVIRYNYGLLLFTLKKYTLSQEQAVIAYDAGFPLNGLKNKLKRVKFWPPKEPRAQSKALDISTKSPK